MKSKKSLIGIAVVALWYLGVVALSAFRPPHDIVALGTDVTLNPPAVAVHDFKCNGVFSGAAVATPLPALKAMPAGAKPLAYSRAPCETGHHDARMIFLFDTAVALLVAVGAGAWWLRQRRHRPHLAAR